jgi:hypothetical protein
MGRTIPALRRGMPSTRARALARAAFGTSAPAAAPVAPTFAGRPSLLRCPPVPFRARLAVRVLTTRLQASRARANGPSRRLATSSDRCCRRTSWAWASPGTTHPSYTAVLRRSQRIRLAAGSSRTIQVYCHWRYARLARSESPQREVCLAFVPWRRACRVDAGPRLRVCGRASRRFICT